MLQKLFALPLLFAALLILVISIFETASIKYAFNQEPSPAPSPKVVVNYELPEPDVTPESPFWALRVISDKIESTPEGYLDSADFRLSVGRDMFSRGKIEESVSVFAKGGLYLKQSFNAVEKMDHGNKNAFLAKLALASLKHREVLETILAQSPEDAKPVVSTILNIPKEVYDRTASSLRSSGLVPPSNPF